MKSAPNKFVRQSPDNTEYYRVRQGNGALASAWGQRQHNAGRQNEEKSSSV